MYLRSLQLINWRSYRSARFEFPRPHGSRNVILIIAPNEYGKTSFFEAITLGLFGREGLTLVPRARTSINDGETDRRSKSYSKFLEGTIHRRAFETGTPECIVKLDWEDESGNPIEIKRTWYFSKSGAHKVADDSLQIYEGQNRMPVAPPATEADRDLWYRDWIAQRFLQASLAEFFLFDGEQVQRYANRDMSEQVRSGIEGLLGLPILRSLQDSLQKYAVNRRAKAAGPSDKVVNAVKAAIDDLEDGIERKTIERDEADKEIPSLDVEIGELTLRLGGRSEGTRALLGSLVEDQRRHEDEAQRAIDDLLKLIAVDMALAISGISLRNETIRRLETEAKREVWEAGRNAGNRHLDRFTRELSRRIEELKPPIVGDLRERVVEAAKAAWEALWHPPPEDFATRYLHTALSGTLRSGTIDRLKAIDDHSGLEASNHVERFNNAVETVEAKKRERLELERIAPEVEIQAKRLKELLEQLGRYKEKRETAQREIDAAEAELKRKRSELGRHVSSMGRGAPALRYADKAEAYAKLVEDILKEAVPFEVNRVAAEMTKAWKAMAHMSERVERIEISPECEVTMLTDDGTDLHQIDKSAGASQVFTQALITAITKVSRRTFPFIVDTPLARLSRDQRLGVLKTFTDRPGQVILLSTDEEVVDDKLDAIRDKISTSYELRITQDSGVSVTTVHESTLGSV